MIKKILKIILISLGSLLAVCLFVILFFIFSEHKPKHKIVLKNLASTKSTTILDKDTIEIFNWNLGYCALGKDSDFILDGGTMSKGISKEVVSDNLKNIITQLNSVNPDLFFIQEVDKRSTRAYFINELSALLDNLKGYNSWYATNYKSPFVPFPPSDPMGSVNAGLLTLSKYQANSSIRYQLPGNYSWPVRIFHLKRCINTIEIPSKDPNKNWFFINIHLSAYDTGGTLRKQQLEYIKTHIISLYDNGNNYVVLGGDWNSLFPTITKSQFGTYTTKEEDLYWVAEIPDDWTPEGWHWGYDTTIPTCRSLEKGFVKGENFLTTIDGFLVSPNLEILEIKAINLDFEYTDHNPVYIKIKIAEVE